MKISKLDLKPEVIDFLTSQGYEKLFEPQEEAVKAGLFDDKDALARLNSMAGLHALGRIGKTSEIAEAMHYLISAEWTTGAILEVDGGLGLGLTAG